MLLRRRRVWLTGLSACQADRLERWKITTRMPGTVKKFERDPFCALSYASCYSEMQPLPQLGCELTLFASPSLFVHCSFIYAALRFCLASSPFNDLPSDLYYVVSASPYSLILTHRSRVAYVGL